MDPDHKDETSVLPGASAGSLRVTATTQGRPPQDARPREGEQPKPPDGRGDETSGRPTAQAEASAGNGSRIRVSTREQTLRWRKGRIFSKRRRKNAPRVKSSDPSLAPAVEVSSREGHAGKVQKPLKSR